MKAAGRQHVEHGASTAARWVACPGSVSLSRGRLSPSTPEAREGTAAHELAAAYLLGKRRPRSIVVEGETVEVTDEMRAAVQDYRDAVIRLCPIPEQKWVEVRLDLERLGPPVPMRGTADYVGYAEGVLDVVDFKYGKGVAVDATENIQAMYYALGAVLTLNKKPHTIRVTIVQPRAHHRDGPIRTYEFGWDRLVEFKRELFEAAERTLDPNAPLVPGDHCRFCPARPVCPAQRSLALEVARNEFEARPLPAPTALTQEQVLRALEVAPVVEQWFNSIRQFVQAELESGKGVPGWKLVAKRATRKWADEEGAVAWASEHDVDPYVKTLRPPAQFEAAVKAAYPARQRPKLPEELVSKQSSGHTLAPADDPRPAVLFLAAADEFSAQPVQPVQPEETEV